MEGPSGASNNLTRMSVRRILRKAQKNILKSMPAEKKESLQDGPNANGSEGD